MKNTYFLFVCYLSCFNCIIKLFFKQYLQGKQTSFFKFVGGIEFHTTYKFRVSSNVYPSTQWLTVAAGLHANSFYVFPNHFVKFNKHLY